MYIFIFIYLYLCMYLYRERERERIQRIHLFPGTLKIFSKILAYAEKLNKISKLTEGKL